jgi:hypothetical protein
MKQQHTTILDKKFASDILRADFCRQNTPDHNALIAVAGCQDFFIDTYTYLRFYHVWRRFRDYQRQMQKAKKGEEVQLNINI